MEPLTIAEAAQALGITREAVRKRIKRGTLQAEKIAGQWRVNLSDTGEGNGRDGGEDASRTAYRTLDPLVEALKGEVQFLREEFKDRTEEVRRRDHIIAGLTSTVRASPEADAGGEAREKMDRGGGPGRGSGGTHKKVERCFSLGEERVRVVEHFGDPDFPEPVSYGFRQAPKFVRV